MLHGKGFESISEALKVKFPRELEIAWPLNTKP